jgi:Chondroitin N-acetylgalactosaminyltransferase
MLACYDHVIYHTKATCFQQDDSAEYSSYHSRRTLRWDTFLPYILDKWGTAYIRGETGKIITRNSSQQLLYGIKTKPVDMVGEEKAVACVRAADAANRWVRAWDYLKVERCIWSGHTTLNSCQTDMVSRVQVRYDRPRGAANSYRTLVIRSSDVDPSCEHWRKFLVEAPVSHDDHIVVDHSVRVEVVTTVKDCYVYLERLVGLLGEVHSRDLSSGGGGLVFTVGDFNSVDGDVKELLLSANFPTVYHSLGAEDFSRSIGLNRTISVVQQKAGVHGNTRVAIIDTSLVMTRRGIEKDGGWLRRIRRYTLPGLSAFAPVYFKVVTDGLAASNVLQLNRDKLLTKEGTYHWSSYGTISVTISDLQAAGGFDVNWGHSWGAEDVDLADRLLRKSKVAFVRLREPDLFHVRDTLSRSGAYYEEKNAFSGVPPLTPVGETIDENSKLLSILHDEAVALNMSTATEQFSIGVTLHKNPYEDLHLMYVRSESADCSQCERVVPMRQPLVTQVMSLE